MNIYKRLNNTFSIILIAIIPFTATAQKLPNVQQSSLRAPANVKIDGKANEWGETLQAYNRATEIYYTLANDDEKLYLTIQAADKVIARKIIAGGITFMVNQTGKKEDAESISLTYPLLTTSQQTNIMLALLAPVTASNPAVIARQSDSLVHLVNTELINDSKEIKVKGVKSIPDSAISVYNALGIKASALFDNKKTLTYELAIPLKYMGITANSPSKLFYNVVLNGLVFTTRSRVYQTNNGPITVSTIPRGITPGNDYQTINYPTDFWGEYTLAKK